MRVVQLIGAAALHAAASLPAMALKLEFNRELSMSFANKGITFAASKGDVPYDLLMDVEHVAARDYGEGEEGGEEAGDGEAREERTGDTFPDGEESDSARETLRVPSSDVSSELRNCHYENEGSEAYESVPIRIVVSSTLSEEEYDKVAQWVSMLYETAATSSYKDLKVYTVIVTGESPPSEEETGAYDAYGYNLLANEGGDRYAPLRTYGDVYESPDDPDLAEQGCQAVFAFVNDHTALESVLSVESALGVDTAINFQICSDGSCCTSAEEYCTALHRIDDAFLYNPMTFTREMSCSNVLEDGVPVIYVDSYGSRSCYCACPAGYIEDSSGDKAKCTPFNPPPCKCEWNKRSGYRKEICSIPPLPPYSEGVDQCAFSGVATDWKVPVPFPTDGYVADARYNGDITLNKDAPHVHITVSKLSNPVYDYSDVMAASTDGKLPHELPEYPSLTVVYEGGEPTVTTDKDYSWSSYHSNRDAIIDEISFSGYGKYQLELDAFDYYGSATCPGCLAIVDDIRPTSTGTCPEGLGERVEGTSTGSGSVCANAAPLTPDNLHEADKKVKEFYQFDENVSNDVCGENKYCNVESYNERKFYEESYNDKSTAYESGSECFDESVVLDDFLNNPTSTSNPLETSEGKCHETDEPVSPSQCTRCCDYHTELRELWIDYRCGYDYDTEHCSGTGADSEKCALHQCLTLDGETLATAETSIQAEIVSATENVLKTLGDAAYDFNSVTQIHDALECSNYGEVDAGRCTYEKTLSQLISGKVQFDSQFAWPEGADASKYVFWRYNIPNHENGWQLWNPYKNSYGELIEEGEVIVFDRPETVIVVEAWSQCGRVARFEYSVHLHLQSVVNVCDYFDEMWYQTTAADRLDKDTYCAYPGSDFAELTFDFHADTGLKNTPNRAKLTLASVSCIGSISGRDAVTLLESDTPNADIISRFGVEMVYKASTMDVTNFDVFCTFTYTGPNGFQASPTCAKLFPIRDCKEPCFDTHAEHCHYTECAGKEKPGLYEACGGTIVSADEKVTYMSATEKECCQGCTGESMEVSCVSLLHLPSETQDLKRCQPLPKTSSEYEQEHHHHHTHESTETEGEGEGETEGETETAYGSPYGDSESATETSTTAGAYDLLADTSNKADGGKSSSTKATVSSTATYGTDETAPTTSTRTDGTDEKNNEGYGSVSVQTTNNDNYGDRHENFTAAKFEHNRRDKRPEHKAAANGKYSKGDSDAPATPAYDSTTDNTSSTTQADNYASTTAATAYGLLASASTAAKEHPEAMALLGSSAFIAVVALVVVKRRADAIRKEQLENDVYYPLLH